MTYLEWGVDSAGRATDSTSCGDIAQNVQNVGSGSVVFWGRYFGHKVYSYNPMNYDTGAQNKAEAAAMRAVGVRRIVPLNSPGLTTTGLTGSAGTSAGNYHGNQVCDGIKSVITNSTGSIILPGSNTCYVYLDVEVCYSLSADFWNAWASAVDSYSYGGLYPFYPCAYFEPGDCCVSGCGGHCDAVDGSGIGCFGVWSNEPEGPNCSGSYGCSFPGPGWGDQCWCNGHNPYTLLWQFMESCGCNGCIDLDYSTPGQDMTTTILYIQ
jgi:hypothetical protein